MIEELKVWLTENRLMFSIDGQSVNIEGFGKCLLIPPKDGIVISPDFCFELLEEEFVQIEDDEDLKYLIFKWGNRFYYCKPEEVNGSYGTGYKPDFNLLVTVGEFQNKIDIPFGNLGVHSGFELLNGSGETDTWAKKAKFYKQDFIGIVDKNTLAGTLPMQLSCDKVGIKSILGMTASIAYDYSADKEHQDIYELIFFAKNETGWRNLLKINKAINVDYDTFCPEDIVFEHCKGLICIFNKSSIVNFNIHKVEKTTNLIKKYRKHFGKSNVFYQIDLTELTDDDTDMKNLNNIASYLKNYYKFLKPVYISDSYYVEKMDWEIKVLLNGISKVSQPHSKNQYFKNIDEVIDQHIDMFKEKTSNIFMESIENISVISEKCNYKIETGEHKLPRFEVDDPIQFYHDRLAEGFERKIFSKYADDPDKIQKYIDRLQEENDVIVNAGFTDYFLILWDIINFCKQADILVGPGRGSAGGSLVAYLLDIIQIDPIEYDLLFERFLNKTRVSGERAKAADAMPDIDLDFEGIRRQEVKRYMERKYGLNSVCSIGTYSRLKVKSSLKDFGRVKGIPFKDVNYATKQIDDESNTVSKWRDIFASSIRKKPLMNFVQSNADFIEAMTPALGQPKAGSIHASAVLILPKEDKNGNPMTIFDWLPVKKIDGALVSEWEGKYVERAGFLKEDILGLQQMDKFKKIIELIEQQRGKRIDLNDIPLNKENVMKYFKKGWNEDIFQFGTSSLKNYSKQVKPDHVEDLISMNALYRPGPMKFKAHDNFALIKHGKMEPKFDIGMKKVTAKTHGLYVYQEQIMQAMVVGGLSLAEADQVRTYMKKFDKVALSLFEEKFVEGMTKVVIKKTRQEKGAKEIAKEIWDKLNAFSAYGFNRSHSAVYALMAYWCQYLKVKYPLEFWTASLNFADEKTEIPNRLSEILSIGSEIEVRPPDINKSEMDFTAHTDEKMIYWSLSKIKMAGEAAVTQILAARQLGGEFIDLADFLKRVPKSKVNKRVVINLILAGALDNIGGEFGLPIKKITQRYDILSNYCQIIKSDIPEDIENSKDKDKVFFWTLKQKAITGFGNINYKSLIKRRVDDKKFLKSFLSPEEFENFDNKEKWGTFCSIAGKILLIKKHNTRNGEMATVSIESNNSVLKVTVWPEQFSKLKTKLSKIEADGTMLAISGQVKYDDRNEKNQLFSSRDTKIYDI